MSMLKNVLRNIKKVILLASVNSKWKRRNAHNHTTIGINCNIDCIEIGKETYGVINAHNFNHNPSDNIGLEIGNYCSIADNVHFLLAGEHDYLLISTFPYRRFRPDNRIINESISKGKIVVEDDVWIGFGVTILSGVHIGRGAVIAAGAVVSSNVPPFAIVGGIPARVLKYRFNEELREILSNIDYEHLTYSDVENHQKLFSTPVDKLPKADLIERLGSLVNSEVGNES